MENQVVLAPALLLSKLPNPQSQLNISVSCHIVSMNVFYSAIFRLLNTLQANSRLAL